MAPRRAGGFRPDPARAIDRAGHDPDDGDLPAAPCVFCGRTVRHVNDGGNAWVCGGIVAGQVYGFLYCNTARCADGADVWRCGCEPDFLDNVGDACSGCKRPRAEALPYVSVVGCPACDADLDAREPGGWPLVRLHCTECGWRGYYDNGVKAGDPP